MQGGAPELAQLVLQFTHISLLGLRKFTMILTIDGIIRNHKSTLNNIIPRHSFGNDVCRRQEFVECTPETCQKAGILQKRRGSQKNPDLQMYVETTKYRKDTLLKLRRNNGQLRRNYGQLRRNYGQLHRLET